MSLREFLRAATRPAHARIDHHPLMARLVRGRLNAENYGTALSALYALHAPIEKSFGTYLSAPDFAPPRRSVDLALDLAELGLDASAVAPLWVGCQPDSHAAYVGMRYVIEGSALGGAVIARQLDQRLPVALMAATRFYCRSTEAEEWPRFWGLVTRLEPIDADLACRRAVGLFSEIEALWDAHLGGDISQK
ncbi:biliverdin-producing heme oxygenase [Paramagnetospirillum kuznetsovii]|uniref:biliverdin-producing heme oxygenase n=1 Tax=Paramagnetospirillum kuznetsovii TaxID=2053833 RepID=UPI001374DFC6|nr:biliverdin-producing heme oxygenase [Paramagnetospirillum kuznetsovii]